jgi:hypothetical protein
VEGNIRATTNRENGENRKRYKSEERKKEKSYFSNDYLKSRYMNSRVEMELV